MLWDVYCDSRLLHLPVGIGGVALDLDASDLFDILRLATNGDRAVLRRVDDRAIGHARRQHQRQVTRTRRDDRLDLRRWRRHFQQRLKAIGLPRALRLDELQPLRLVDHVRREHKAADRLGWGQFVYWLRLYREHSWLGLARHDLLVQCFGVGMQTLHRRHDDLIVGVQMLARQRPDVDAAAVLRQERRRILAQMVHIHDPEADPAGLEPLPRVAQEAELNPLVASGGRAVVIVGRIAPQPRERFLAGDESLGVTAHGLFDTETFHTLRRPLAVQFVGVGRDVPRLRRHVEELALTGERIEQSVSGCRRRDERRDCRVVVRVDGIEAEIGF